MKSREPLFSLSSLLLVVVSVLPYFLGQSYLYYGEHHSLTIRSLETVFFFARQPPRKHRQLSNQEFSEARDKRRGAL